MGREPRGIEPVFITTAQAAACLGPTTQPPLGKVAQQSESAARITRTATLSGEPTMGGATLGRVRFQSLIGCSPFTIRRLLSLARECGSNYPHTYLLERTYVHDRNARAHGFALERWRSRPPVDK